MGQVQFTFPLAQRINRPETRMHCFHGTKYRNVPNKEVKSALSRGNCIFLTYILGQTFDQNLNRLLNDIKPHSQGTIPNLPTITELQMGV